MNWQRIWTGSLLAGLVFFTGDFIINHLLLGAQWKALMVAGYIKGVRAYTVPVLLLVDVGIGFVLMWLYALARPRLGPGPKTALTLGSLAWFLIYVPLAAHQFLWAQIPCVIPITLLIAGLVQCWISIYVAGWQYIERAP
jgi:hypothetical protein